MTKQVVIKPSGKVDGIRGLYISQSSNRVYVRYSFHGFDKQLTIHPKNMTFSELKRESVKALNVLKRSVLNEYSEKTPAEREPVSPVEYGIKKLPIVISKHWSFKGRSQCYIDYLIFSTKGLAICEKDCKSNINAIDKHNAEVAQKIISTEGLSQSQRFKLFNAINICFTQLISSGRHFGLNPVRDVPKPIYTARRRNGELNFEQAAKVLLLIRNDKTCAPIKRLECELFFRLAVETGQRPKDIYMFNVAWIDNEHYQFRSHKTKTEHRVKHLLSRRVLDLISQIIIARSGSISYHQKWKNKHVSDEEFDCFWSLALFTYEFYLNVIIRNNIDENLSLYSARHFFVSEIFRTTESEFWAEVFTHDGKNTNQRNYLHPEQRKADDVLGCFMDSFESVLSGVILNGNENNDSVVDIPF